MPSQDITVPTEFVWKYGGNRVILTGSFDNWQQSIAMKKDSLGIFRATLLLNPYIAWSFKFVVDGVWRCCMDSPTTVDQFGNVNNFLDKCSSA